MSQDLPSIYERHVFFCCFALVHHFIKFWVRHEFCDAPQQHLQVRQERNTVRTSTTVTIVDYGDRCPYLSLKFTVHSHLSPREKDQRPPLWVLLVKQTSPLSLLQLSLALYSKYMNRNSHDIDLGTVTYTGVGHILNIIAAAPHKIVSEFWVRTHALYLTSSGFPF